MIIANSPVIVTDLTFDDIEPLSAAAKGWNQHYLQLSRGQLRARLTSVELSGLIITRERANLAIAQHSWLTENCFMVAEAGHCDERSRYQGQPCVHNTVSTLSRPEELIFRAADGFDISYALIDQDRLRAAAMDRVRWDLPRQMDSVRTVTGNRRANAALGDYMREVTVAACADSGPFRTAAVQEQVFDGLLTRLLAVADPALPRPRHARTALARRRAIVRTIDDYVAGNPDASPTLQELCRIAHASERTLQYAFRYCYDVSPTHYVKLIRLHRVRRALLASEPGAGAVTAVANRFGFWHMGHFGQAYREVFQESPSSTLRVQ